MTTGQTPADMVSLFGPVIHAYSRAAAIADGVLVDVTVGRFAGLASRLGFRWPVAMTAAAYAATIELTPWARGMGEDETSRLTLVLMTTACWIKNDSPERYLVAVPRDAEASPAVALRVVAGAGDGGEPVVTIMLADED